MKFIAVKITHKETGIVVCERIINDDVSHKEVYLKPVCEGAWNGFVSLKAVPEERYIVQTAEIDVPYEQVANLQEKENKVWIVSFVDYSGGGNESNIVGAFSTEKEAEEYAVKWGEKYRLAVFRIKESVIGSIDIDTDPYDADNGVRAITFTCLLGIDDVTLIAEESVTIKVPINATDEEIETLKEDYYNIWLNSKIRKSYK